MDTRTKQAVEFLKAGKSREGFAELNKIVAENPSNALAWYAISFFTSDTSLKRQALETVLRLIPNHPKAKADLDALTRSTETHNIDAHVSTEASLKTPPSVSSSWQEENLDFDKLRQPIKPLNMPSKVTTETNRESIANLGASQQIDHSEIPDNYIYDDNSDLESRVDDLEIKLNDLDARLDHVEAGVGNVFSVLEDVREAVDGHSEIINKLVDSVNNLARNSHRHSRYSDIALKEDVAVIGNALVSILAVRGVSFTWTSSPSSVPLPKTGRDLGVIAQDVAAVLPELVTTDAESGLQMVDYQGFVPLLIEAIRQQQAQIDELRTLIRAQEKVSTPNPQVY